MQTRTVPHVNTVCFISTVTTSKITSVHVWLQDLRAQGIHIPAINRCIKQTRAASVNVHIAMLSPWSSECQYKEIKA